MFYEEEDTPCERRVRAVVVKAAEWRVGPRPQPEAKWRATLGEIIEQLEQLLDNPPVR